MEKKEKLIIDQQLAHGLGEELIAALSRYFKIEEEKIRIRNDETSPEHTLITLEQVRRSHPKIKLRLQELERFQRTEIYYQSDEDITDIELRIEDAVIVELSEKIAKK